MKKTSLLVILLIGLLNTQVSAKWFQQKTIFSKALQQEKTYYVGLPDGYNEADTTRKYPVIVFLHGASVTATDMVNTIEPYLDNFFFRLFFNNLFKVIFIIPDGSCEPYNGSFYTNSALYGNYEDYIVQDLSDEIKSNYHTFRSREKWSIMGHSMGGFGAMKIALKYPEKYIGVSSLSGPLNITAFDELLPVILSEHGSAAPYDFTYSGDVTRLIYSMAGAFSPNTEADPPIDFPINSSGSINSDVLNTWEKNNPINLIREWNGSPAMAIYSYCGELDEFKLAKPNQMFSDTLDKYNLPHTYVQDPAGDHINSLMSSFPQGINFLYDVMDTAQIRNVTSVNKIWAANSLNIYPNPAKDRFFVADSYQECRQITIYNLSGQKIMQLDNPILSNGIDVSNFGNGIYLVKLQNSKGTAYTRRLVKD